MAKPYQVADETFVIPADLPVPGIGKLPVNAMVIRGAEPMIIDTLAIVHRETFLEEAFALVDPADVRWLFISHEDRDHTGSIMQVLERCPNARLITTFLGLGKLGEEFSIPPERAYFLNDGESMTIGDRQVTAIRPPLYDSSATRGLWDPSTGIYFGADCFGVVTADVPEYTDEMTKDAFEEAFFFMNRVNHVWFHDVPKSAIEREANRIKVLGPRLIVSGHGPVERRDPIGMCDAISRVADMEPIPMPTQAEFERMLASA
jgi:flavorubredoxin